MNSRLQTEIYWDQHRHMQKNWMFKNNQDMGETDYNHLGHFYKDLLWYIEIFTQDHPEICWDCDEKPLCDDEDNYKNQNGIHDSIFMCIECVFNRCVKLSARK